jgi:hypothetical protein
VIQKYWAKATLAQRKLVYYTMNCMYKMSSTVLFILSREKNSYNTKKEEEEAINHSSE